MRNGIIGLNQVAKLFSSTSCWMIAKQSFQMVVESTDAIEFKVLPFFRNFFSRGDKGVKIFDIEKSKKKNFALDFLRKNVVLIFFEFLIRNFADNRNKIR